MFHATTLHFFSEFFFVLHELDFHIHLAARRLNLAQKKQVFHERENARSGVSPGSRQRLRIDYWIRRRKSRPPRSSAAVAVIAVEVGAIAVVHRRGEDSLLLLASHAHWPPAAATFGRPPSTTPFVSSSTLGRTSRSCRSCIHIFSLVNVEFDDLNFVI